MEPQEVEKKEAVPVKARFWNIKDASFHTRHLFEYPEEMMNSLVPQIEKHGIKLTVYDWRMDYPDVYSCMYINDNSGYMLDAEPSVDLKLLTTGDRYPRYFHKGGPGEYEKDIRAFATNVNYAGDISDDDFKDVYHLGNDEKGERVAVVKTLLDVARNLGTPLFEKERDGYTTYYIYKKPAFL
jgi:hypothetical protein